MAKIRIGFRSGTVEVLNLDECTVTKNTVDNRVTGITWKGKTGILFMALDQIDFVLEDR